MEKIARCSEAGQRKKMKTAEVVQIHPGRDVKRFIRELQLHQAELEAQNEALRSVQSQLEEAWERYSHLYHYAPVGYFTLDCNGTILEVNLKGSEQLGIENRRLLRTPFSMYVNQQDQALFFSHLRTIFHEMIQASCNLRIDRKDFTFEGRIESIVVRRMDGRAVCRMTLSNITRQVWTVAALRKKAAEAEEAERMKSQLLSSLVSDLEAPVNAMIGYIALLKNRASGPPVQGEALPREGSRTKADMGR